MGITEAIEKIGEKLGVNTSRLIAFPYLIFLVLCSLHWFGLTDIPKQWFLSLSKATWLHTLGVVSIIITAISLWSNHSRKKLNYHITQIFKKEPKDADTQKLIQPNLTEKEFVKSLMEWSKDAHEVYIFGGSGNFLREDNSTNQLEFEELKKLGGKCKLLIKENFTASIDKLRELTENGVQIRTYPFGDLHIRGRLKKDTSGTQSYLCSKKNGKYTTQSIPLLEVSKLLLTNFNELFSKGGNPYIKCIMFDKGGVWCEVSDTEWQLNEGITKLASDLSSKGYSVVIHSNCNSTVGEKLKKEGYFKGFRLFFSYEMDLKKPDREFYKSIIDKLNLKPYQCVFIDDNDDNIDTAKVIGMEVIRVDTYEDLNCKFNKITKELEKLQVRI